MPNLTIPTAGPHPLQKWHLLGTFGVVLVGCTVLIGGWTFGNETLIHLGLTQAAMVPSTAVSFLVAGGALLWAEWPGVVRVGRVTVLRAAAAVVTALALFDLSLLLSPASSGIDALLWPEVDAFSTYSMSPATAFCFLLTAVCLVQLSRDRTCPPGLFVAAATAGLLSAGVTLTGYAFDSEALYAVSIFSAMALHTAVTFTLLFGTILLTRPDCGWVGILTGRGPGSSGARRLFPVILLSPFILGLTALSLTEAGLFNANFRLSLLAILMMALGAAAVLRNAVLENRAQERQTQTLADLRRALNDRDILLREVHHRVKNNLQQINAMIFFESSNIEDEPAKESFRAISGRITALALVHQLLISSAVPSQVDFGAFVRDLCANVSEGLGAGRRGITVEASVPDGPVDIDVAVTLGLLVNEVLTNALKHGYPEGRSGRIIVSLTEKDDGGALLSIKDDGIGAGRSVRRPAAGSGVGSRIIRALTRQLEADMDMTVNGGTEVTVTLPAGFRNGGSFGATTSDRDRRG